MARSMSDQTDEEGDWWDDPDVCAICGEECIMDAHPVVCLDCGWTGGEIQLKAQACPLCDGRVADV